MLKMMSGKEINARINKNCVGLLFSRVHPNSCKSAMNVQDISEDQNGTILTFYTQHDDQITQYIWFKENLHVFIEDPSGMFDGCENFSKQSFVYHLHVASCLYEKTVMIDCEFVKVLYAKLEDYYEDGEDYNILYDDGETINGTGGCWIHRDHIDETVLDIVYRKDI